MNKERRKNIQHCVDALSEIQSKIDDIHSDEESAFDNLPEGLQGSSWGESLEEAMEILEEASGLVDDTICCLKDLV